MDEPKPYDEPRTGLRDNWLRVELALVVAGMILVLALLSVVIIADTVNP